MLKFVLAAFVLCTLTVPSFGLSHIEQAQPTSSLCELCTLVLGTAQSLLEQNKTQDQVLEFIEKNLCGRLGPLNATCVQYMQADGPEIIYELSQKIDPSIVCHKIGLCAVPKEEEKVEEKNVNGAVCELCTLVLGTAQNLLEQNKTESEVLAFIEKNLCGRLGPLNATCTQYMETEGREILYELSQKIDPSIVCKKIGLCSTGKVQGLKKISKRSPKVDVNPIECTVCQYVIQFLDAELGGNKTEAAVVSALDKVCNYTPASLRATCQNLVNQYGPYLVKLLFQFSDPLEICQILKAC